jgi:hypothetical protein
MKKTLKIALTIFVIAVLSISAFMFYKFLNERNSKNEINGKLELSEAKISLYNDTVTILKQDTAKLLKRVDSLQKLVFRGKSEVFAINGKIKLLEAEKLKIYSQISDMTELEQVGYFISFTGENYGPLKMGDKYLISFESIKFANKAFLDGEFHLKNNLLLIEQIESMNRVMFSQDQQIKTFLEYKTATDKMFIMKDLIIAEHNTKDIFQDGRTKNFKKQRDIAYGLAVLSLLVVVVK